MVLKIKGMSKDLMKRDRVVGAHRDDSNDEKAQKSGKAMSEESTIESNQTQEIGAKPLRSVSTFVSGSNLESSESLGVGSSREESFDALANDTKDAVHNHTLIPFTCLNNDSKTILRDISPVSNEYRANSRNDVHNSPNESTEKMNFVIFNHRILIKQSKLLEVALYLMEGS